MPLVINSLGGGHTHRHSRTEAILRIQEGAWFKNVISKEHANGDVAISVDLTFTYVVPGL